MAAGKVLDWYYSTVTSCSNTSLFTSAPELPSFLPVLPQYCPGVAAPVLPQCAAPVWRGPAVVSSIPGTETWNRLLSAGGVWYWPYITAANCSLSALVGVDFVMWRSELCKQSNTLGLWGTVCSVCVLKKKKKNSLDIFFYLAQWAKATVNDRTFLLHRVLYFLINLLCETFESFLHQKKKKKKKRHWKSALYILHVSVCGKTILSYIYLQLFSSLSKEFVVTDWSEISTIVIKDKAIIKSLDVSATRWQMWSVLRSLGCVFCVNSPQCKDIGIW